MTQTTIQGDLLTAEEFRELLQMSQSAFYRRLSSGKIPQPIRLGKLTRWLRSDVMGWLRAGAPSAEEWERLKRKEEV